MDLNYQHQYNGSADQVAELMRNREFIDDVARSSGAVSHSVEINGNVAHLVMVMAAPAKITKFVGSTIELQQDLAWGEPNGQGVREGDFSVTVKQAPVTMNAKGVLTPAGEARSTASFRGTLTVKIPLVGKKVEAQVEPFIADAMAGIERRANEWLART